MRNKVSQADANECFRVEFRGRGCVEPTWRFMVRFM